MSTHSNILAWRILWTEGPGGLQSMGSQRVRQHGTTHATAISKGVLGRSGLTHFIGQIFNFKIEGFYIYRYKYLLM